MKRRWTFAALGAAAACAMLVVLWQLVAARPDVDRSRATGAAGSTPPVEPPRAADADAGITATVHDRAVRDRVRARIYESWGSAAAPAVPAAPPPGGAPPPAGGSSPASTPTSAGSPVVGPRGPLDAPYIRSRIREDFAPMAQQCYEDFLRTHAGTSVRVMMGFRILGDPRWGGVVDSAFVETQDGGTVDPELATCMRESMLSMAFRPPPEGGEVTVHYPFVMSP